VITWLAFDDLRQIRTGLALLPPRKAGSLDDAAGFNTGSMALSPKSRRFKRRIIVNQGLLRV
jgi:hypothetical protein